MVERDAWRLRPAITAAIGLIAAVIVQRLLHTDRPPAGYVEPTHARIALSVAIGASAGVAIFVLTRARLWLCVGFAAGCGVVAGLVTWWNGAGNPGVDWFFNWPSACLAIALAIAATLYQTADEEGDVRFPYAEVHGHAWTNAVLFPVGMAFTGIAFALAYLLSALFDLIGIHLLRDLLRHDWAGAALAGAAFGGAVGLMRERDRIVRTLQKVVMAVLSVLAPVLGAGLMLFLLALPFTGLSALWDATKSTTPIMLACVIGAFLLINAVLGDGEEDEASNPALRWGAMALGLAMLPLSAIAAIATGLRIQQYGLTPDRLWALTFIVVASACGLAYLVSLLRGRQAWATLLRRTNLRLAFALLGVTLLLATPLVGFNRLSTNDQVARLTSGKVMPESFDFAALAFDFGAPGRAALNRLAQTASGETARLARAAMAKSNRYEVMQLTEAAERKVQIGHSLRVVPAPTALPNGLVEAIADEGSCGGSAGTCALLYHPGDQEAFLIADGCTRGSPYTCHTVRFALTSGKWSERSRLLQPDVVTAKQQMLARITAEAVKRGDVQVRSVARRQLFVGGQPVGDVFE